MTLAPRSRFYATPLALCLALHCWIGAHAAETLQALVNRANTAANANQTETAIALYEQVVAKAPHDEKLRHNLAVLYFNLGMARQQDKRYTEANALFDKSRALTPDEDAPQKAKAASFYYQAAALRDAPQPDLAQIRALIQQAIALDPSETAYPRLLASALHREAMTRAQDERYAEAIPLWEEAHRLDPQADVIQKSLANGYLGLARLTVDDPGKREEALAKARATDSSPEISEKAAKIAAGKPESDSELSAIVGAPKTRGATLTAPVGSESWSLSQRLAALEKTLALPIAAEAPLASRLEKVETALYGKPQKGPVNTRIDRAFVNALGGGQTFSASLPDLVQPTIQNTAGTYLDEIFRTTDGRVVRWGRFPLKISIEAPKDNALYTPAFEQAILDGLSVWKTATHGFVSFIRVANADAADIRISWEDVYHDRFSDPKFLDDNPIKRYEPPKASRAAQMINMASMFAPGYFALAPQAVAAGIQYREMRKLQAIADESRIVLGLKPVEGLSPEAAALRIRNLAAYEFGHALGLKGVSPDAADLMHTAPLTTETPVTPSTRDVATLRELYARPANIVLNLR
ncbi:MAG: matrixin family metalloprotease [Vampirovibrionales bacterium]|nr:matrixin family metalloprotease [Vampirovibrionales bacterium]